MGEERRHRNYDAEFKREAVRLVMERGIAVRKVAQKILGFILLCLLVGNGNI